MLLWIGSQILWKVSCFWNSIACRNGLCWFVAFSQSSCSSGLSYCLSPEPYPDMSIHPRFVLASQAFCRWRTPEDRAVGLSIIWGTPSRDSIRLKMFWHPALPSSGASSAAPWSLGDWHFSLSLSSSSGIIHGPRSRHFKCFFIAVKALLRQKTSYQNYDPSCHGLVK